MVIVVGIAGMLVQWRLRSVISKYSEVPMPQGLTGAEVAERMLRQNGITDVTVTHTGGYLTDHYDPRNKTVNLSEGVYNSCSISAAAIACHECGHAIQHAQGYAPLALRSKLVPLVSFSSSIATWVIIGGLMLMASTNNTTLCWIGIGLVATSALFSIVTLPVEYNASERALAWLEASRTLHGDELDGARISLRWAARTYLVAALSAIATVLYYITLVSGRRND